MKPACPDSTPKHKNTGWYIRSFLPFSDPLCLVLTLCFRRSVPYVLVFSMVRTMRSSGAVAPSSHAARGTWLSVTPCRKTWRSKRTSLASRPAPNSKLPRSANRRMVHSCNKSKQHENDYALLVRMCSRLCCGCRSGRDGIRCRRRANE